MSRIIDLIIRLNFKLAELAFRFALAVVEALIGVVKRHKSTPPVPKGEPPSAYSQAPVHVSTPAPTMAASAAHPSHKPMPQNVAAVLANPDRHIYYLVGDHVQRHPHSEALDDLVTRMAFTAMHRDGEPFQMTPELDQSGPAVGPFTPPPIAEPTPFAGVQIPPPDNEVYVLHAGQIAPQSAWR